MRFNPYDDVLHTDITFTSIAVKNFNGTSGTAVNSDSVDTGLVFDADSAMIHVRAEIASGAPTTFAVAWALQESNDNSTWTAANDNTGTAIGASLNVLTVAQDSYARIEGIMLNNSASSGAQGGRKRYLRVAITPTYTGGTTPGSLVFAELLGAPGAGAVFPVRTAVSNT